jgi:UDP-N-acetylglucosamine enolpyruvyl transferase
VQEIESRDKDCMKGLLKVDQSTLKSGRIRISGYRHSSNLILISTLLMPGVEATIENIPLVSDTEIILSILSSLGAKVEFDRAGRKVVVSTSSVENRRVDPLESSKLHGSIYLMPALVSRFGVGSFVSSGGCQIGSLDDSRSRPHEHILSVLQAFGVEITKSEKDGLTKDYEFRLDGKKEGVTIDINDYLFWDGENEGSLTSGATKTALLLGLASSDGVTTILNPFLKSEVVDLIDFFRSCGVDMDFDEEKIVIRKRELKSSVAHEIISDPSEIVTYACLAAYHEVNLVMENVSIARTVPILEPEFGVLKEMGVSISVDGHSIGVSPQRDIRAVDIEVTPRGVCTDHHPLLVSLMSKVDGTSTLVDKVWPERFMYVRQLEKIGLSLVRKDNKITVEGKIPTEAVDVLFCDDLRAAALIIILAIKTPGSTMIEGYEHVFRGYPEFFENLRLLGASVEYA